MSRPIQTNPAGMLSLLGLKNNGENPPVMVDSLQPTIDLADFYRASRILHYTETVALATDTLGWYGLAAPGIVPLGEVWYIESITTTIIPTAAPSAGARTTIIPAMGWDGIPPNIVAVGPTKASYVTPAARTAIAVAAWVPKAILVTGAQIGFMAEEVDELAGGTLTAKVDLRFVRLFA